MSAVVIVLAVFGALHLLIDLCHLAIKMFTRYQGWRVDRSSRALDRAWTEYERKTGGES